MLTLVARAAGYSDGSFRIRHVVASLLLPSLNHASHGLSAQRFDIGLIVTRYTAIDTGWPHSRPSLPMNRYSYLLDHTTTTY